MHTWKVYRSFLFSVLVLLFPTPLHAYRVVIIGDSHSEFLSGCEYGIFGARLLEILKAKKYETSLYAASGSSPIWWTDKVKRSSKTMGATVEVDGKRETPSFVPKLADIFRQQKLPVDLVVIEQGTNLLDEKRIQTDIPNPGQIKALVVAVAPKTNALLWVGAPNYPEEVFNKKQQEALWIAIKDNVKGEKCHVYDSRFQPTPNADGQPVPSDYCGITSVKDGKIHIDSVHLCAKAAIAWADGVGLMIDQIHNKSTDAASTHQ